MKSETTSSLSAWNDRKFKKLMLFDVDGTLTPSRKKVHPEMLDLLAEVRSLTPIAFVGGSDLVKQQEQLGSQSVDVIDLFDYAFAENGVEAFKESKLIAKESFIQWLGEEKYKEFINFVLSYLAQIDIPVKRGTFVEFRSSMINISPIGRNASSLERDEFEAYDKKHNVRKSFIEALKKKFPDLGLTYSIGGQISFDVFPQGWDKTYCLRHLENEGFEEIHFFGDKTWEGGNDYEIYSDARVIGHTVKNPDETMKLLREMFNL